MLTKVTIAKVIRFTHTHTLLNSGTASVSQAAASPLGWGQMISSWFFLSAPSIDKRPQATTQPTSISKKGSGTLSSCSACLMLFISERPWRS